MIKIQTMLGEIALLGHILVDVTSDIVVADLAKPDWQKQAKKCYEGKTYEQVTVSMQALLTECGKDTDWGNNESGYNYACKSMSVALRCAVTLNGKCLEVLAYDEDAEVRACVVEGLLRDAARGINHDDVSYLDDILTNNPTPLILLKIAKYGVNKHLNALLNSEHVAVRAEVAAQGSLEQWEHLIHDPSDVVRAAVAQVADYNQLCELSSDPSAKVREAVARRGVQLLALADDVDAQVRMAVAETASLATSKDPSACVHIDLSCSPQIFDKLAHDEMVAIRMIAALKGNDSHRTMLLNDSSPQVRRVLASLGFSLETLMADEDPAVRQEAIQYPATNTSLFTA